jgi:hypothetical protein
MSCVRVIVVYRELTWTMTLGHGSATITSTPGFPNGIKNLFRVLMRKSKYIHSILHSDVIITISDSGEGYVHSVADIGMQKTLADMTAV